MNYFSDEVKTVETKMVSAWLVEVPGQPRVLEVWDSTATIDQVALNIPRDPGTKITRVDVGFFVIDHIVQSMSFDSRSVRVLPNGGLEIGV